MENWEFLKQDKMENFVFVVSFDYHVEFTLKQWHLRICFLENLAACSAVGGEYAGAVNARAKRAGQETPATALQV